MTKTEAEAFNAAKERVKELILGAGQVLSMYTEADLNNAAREVLRRSTK